jgi:hypothetical protein
MEVYFSRGRMYLEREYLYFGKIRLCTLKLHKNPSFLEKTVQCYNRCRLKSIVFCSVNRVQIDNYVKERMYQEFRLGKGTFCLLRIKCLEVLSLTEEDVKDPTCLTLLKQIEHLHRALPPKKKGSMQCN